MTKRQKLGETLQKLLLSISHWKPLVNLFTKEFLSNISASLKGHLKGVQLTSLPCGGHCLTKSTKSSVSAPICTVCRSATALEDLWFLSCCCFFYKYIQEIFLCKVDEKMSLVVVLRQEAASRCLAYWRAERETGCLRHMQPPPPSVCLSGLSTAGPPSRHCVSSLLYGLFAEYNAALPERWKQFICHLYYIFI